MSEDEKTEDVRVMLTEAREELMRADGKALLRRLYGCVRGRLRVRSEPEAGTGLARTGSATDAGTPR